MRELKRLESGVQGLDAIMSGGLIAGASYLVHGRPGSGKTILANQIAFHHVGNGGKVIFVSLLSESHDRLLQFLSTLSFFESEKIGKDLLYISAFDVLDSKGLDEVIRVIRNEIIRNKATLLILDGLMNARSQAETPLNTKLFIAQLQAHATFAGCSMLFLTSAEVLQGSPELTMVDGVLALADQDQGVQSSRTITVRKSRGSASLPGKHEYQITADGIKVFPRYEELALHPVSPQCIGSNRVSSGISGLDEALDGGIHEHSISLVFGPSGCGKTTFGLNFVSQANPREKGLWLSLYETPEQLLQKSDEYSLGLQDLIQTGCLSILWAPTAGFSLDDVALRTLAMVREQGIKRVFIDSLSALVRPATDQGRLVQFIAALTKELRGLGAATCMTWETSGFPASDLQAPPTEVCSLVDNILMLHFAEGTPSGAPLRLSIFKIRNGRFDRRANGVSIGKGGIQFEGKRAPEVVDPLSKT